MRQGACGQESEDRVKCFKVRAGSFDSHTALVRREQVDSNLNNRVKERVAGMSAW